MVRVRVRKADDGRRFSGNTGTRLVSQAGGTGVRETAVVQHDSRPDSDYRQNGPTDP